jgi:hypothetical protein
MKSAGRGRGEEGKANLNIEGGARGAGERGGGMVSLCPCAAIGPVAHGDFEYSAYSEPEGVSSCARPTYSETSAFRALSLLF